MPISDFKLETVLQVSGNVGVSGSVSASGGFTGSLFGTASYGQDSNLLDGLDSTAFARLGSANIFTQTQTVSGNLFVTASVSSSNLTASVITGSELNIDYIDFVPQPSATPPTQQVGRVFVDNLYNEVNTWTDVTGVKLLQGQQLVLRAKCTDMATFTKGTVVRINGGTGANATFVTASWENDTNSADTLGFLMNSGVTNDFAYIIINGYLTDINTDDYTPGQTLYLSSSGNYTNVVPVYPYHEIRLGQVVRAHATVGSVFVRVQNGYELGELHDVYTGSLSPGDLLVYENTVNTQWTNKKQLTGSYGLTGSLTASVGLSGALGLFPVLTGSSVSGTTAQFTIITGSAISGALIGTLNTISVINAGSNLTASNVGSIRTLALTSSVVDLSSLSSATGSFTILTGSTTTGSTALFTTISGSTITGSNLSYTTLNTTQMTSSGKILVDNNVTIGNGKTVIATNFAIGFQTLASSDSNSANNIAIGYQALSASTSGSRNVAIGSLAGKSVVGNGDGVYIGYNAGTNSKANASIAIGSDALAAHAETGNQTNVAIGSRALTTLAAGAGNYAIGSNAAAGLKNGNSNFAIGTNTMGPFGSNMTCSNNLAIGAGALGGPGGAGGNYTNNTAIGYNSMAANLSGIDNTAIGGETLLYNTTGSYSVAIGRNSLKNIISGSQNVALGYQAGVNLKTGSNNVYIGGYGGVDDVNNNIYISDGVGNLRLQVDSNGTFDVKSGQIKFPATQNASSDPNTLDDYEEGTWTPALSASITNTGFTYNTTNTSGSYIKVGKMVRLTGRLTLTATGSAAGNVFITGLPLTNADTGQGNFGTMNTAFYQFFDAGVTNVFGRLNQGANVVTLAKAGTGAVVDMSVTDLSTTSDIIFIVHYNHTT